MMNFRWIFLVCLLVACSDESDNLAPSWQNTALVETISGPVSGSDADIASWSWKGIPFAEPPLGDLRFRAPRLPAPWIEPVQALDYGSACVQVDVLTSQLTGDEDCLTLNVWRPRTLDQDLPVYVWIHGGGNTSGSAREAGYDGTNLAVTSNVIVVSLQYRLGPFGWLLDSALADGDAGTDSGNYGTLDLIAGLEWIRDNIRRFGGNADNVIITGESAGGINVLSLLLSPRAQGLFHKAVSQSALKFPISNEAGQLFTEDLKPAVMVAEGLAPDEDAARHLLAGMHPDDIAELLRSAAPASLMDSIPRIGVGLLAMPFLFPDGNIVVSNGTDAFEAGNYPSRVPLLIGTNSGDVRLFLWFLEPQLLGDPPLFNAVSDIGGGIWKASSADFVAAAMSSHSDQPPVYVYRFDWGRYDPFGNGVTPMPWNFFFGAAHAMEIPFFLDNLDSPGFFGDLSFTEENRPGREALGDLMVAYMQRFIASGDPNGDDLPDWPAWSSNPGDPRSLVLDADLEDLRLSVLTETATVESALAEIELIGDPALREKVRTLLNEFTITCTLLADIPALDCPL